MTVGHWNKKIENALHLLICSCLQDASINNTYQYQTVLPRTPNLDLIAKFNVNFIWIWQHLPPLRWAEAWQSPLYALDPISDGAITILTVYRTQQASNHISLLFWPCWILYDWPSILSIWQHEGHVEAANTSSGKRRAFPWSQGSCWEVIRCLLNLHCDTTPLLAPLYSIEIPCLSSRSLSGDRAGSSEWLHMWTPSATSCQHDQSHHLRVSGRAAASPKDIPRAVRYTGRHNVMSLCQSSTSWLCKVWKKTFEFLTLHH